MGLGMGMRMGGGSAESCLCFAITACTGSRLCFCARCQPHTGVAGSADKGRAGPRDHPAAREERQPRAGLVPRRGSRTPARSDDSFTSHTAAVPWKFYSRGAPARIPGFQTIVNAHLAAQQLCSKPNLLPRPQTPHHSSAINSIWRMGYSEGWVAEHQVPRCQGLPELQSPAGRPGQRCPFLRADTKEGGCPMQQGGCTWSAPPPPAARD